MGNLTISRILIVFGVLVTAGLGLSIGLQTLALSELKIGGPAYSDIIDGKDLVADILPPPLFLVEAYSLASEGAIDPKLAKENAEKIKALKTAYDDRRSYWTNSGLPEDLKSKLETDVLAKGDIFWHDLETDYFTAVAADNPEAIRASIRKLKDGFHAHEKAVGELVQSANAFLGRSEHNAEQLGGRLGTLAMAGSAISVILFLAGLWFMRMRAISPLTSISQYMRLLADGDYSKEVPLTERQDEIGNIAKAVDTFRFAAIERQRLQQEIDAGRTLSESERVEREKIRAQEAQDLKVVVETLGAGLGRLAECNIRMTIDDKFAPGFEALRNDFNNSLATFQMTLEEVLDKTSHLFGSAQEMRQAADNLSKRTEQQAAALEETAASLEQVTVTVQASVDRTAETRSLVREARVCATESGTVVRDAIEAMKRIEGASSEIGQIIDVIDEIAFQTNLLALNAGVEAARAGDAGKGFAVVAQEVRELAQRSAKAAKEISGLISNSSSEVANGVRLVAETGSVLDRIEGYVSEIDIKVEAITVASREQSVGLREISGAVNSIDQMTQQNAAMVEETTAISHSLATDSQALTELVNRFKLNRRSAVREQGSTVGRSRAA